MRRVGSVEAKPSGTLSRIRAFQAWAFRRVLSSGSTSTSMAVRGATRPPGQNRVFQSFFMLTTVQPSRFAVAREASAPLV